MEVKKKLSHNIERVGEFKDGMISAKFKYVYKFNSNQFLENMDLPLVDMSSYSENDVKEILIEQLLIEFKCALNGVIFGEPAGRHYVEHLEKEKKYSICSKHQIYDKNCKFCNITLK